MQVHTLNAAVTLTGLGIHSGKTVTLTLHPCESGQVYFVRQDAPDILIPAKAEYAKPNERATRLEKDSISILTPEHILSALYAKSIFSARINISAEECPILDGSSQTIIEAIESVGTRPLSSPISPLIITNPVSISEADKTIVALPYDGQRFTYILEYPNTFIGTQSMDIDLATQNYKTEIAPARTYGFKKEIDALLAKGLAQGGSLDNALVIGDTDYINALKFPNELARHKTLDLIGDLMLVGKPIKGHVIAFKTGHSLNTRFAQKLLDTKSQ